MFNLGVPHVCLLFGKRGTSLEEKICPHGFKSCDRG
jgi:hypothetical protein